MKKIALLITFIAVFCGFSQVPAYYSGIDFTQNGSDLKDDLSILITTTHTPITYSEVWNVLKVSDLDPSNSANVLLVYGYLDDADPVTDRTRDKDLNGGLTGEWNREHIFPKSLGVPDLGSSGPGSDSHNLRASDVQQNGNRGNRKFATGSGNAGNAGTDWYPGDEWKGDCARIIMYMYLRYGSQCIPGNAVSGTTNAGDPNMIDLLLDWNVEDPVSTHEEDRNDGIYAIQNNRNPFIDNPYIATKIWGGTPAEDPWGGVSISETSINWGALVYPNPVVNYNIYFSTASLSSIDRIQFFAPDGRLVDDFRNKASGVISLNVENLPCGTYLLKVHSKNAIIQQRIIIQ